MTCERPKNTLGIVTTCHRDLTHLIWLKTGNLKNKMGSAQRGKICLTAALLKQEFF